MATWPKSVMNSRRLIATHAAERHRNDQTNLLSGVRIGSEQSLSDAAECPFGVNRYRNGHRAMSALPWLATNDRTSRDVRKVPKD